MKYVNKGEYKNIANLNQYMTIDNIIHNTAKTKCCLEICHGDLKKALLHIILLSPSNERFYELILAQIGNILYSSFLYSISIFISDERPPTLQL